MGTDATELGGHLKVVKLLLGAGANVDSKDDKYEWTPLTWAVYHSHLEVVKWLESVVT